MTHENTFMKNWSLARYRKIIFEQMNKVTLKKDIPSRLLSCLCYDAKFPFILNAYETADLISFVVDELKLKVERFLEIGVYLGGSFRIWSHLFPDSVKIGVDKSNIINKAAIDAKRNNIKNCFFIQGDSRDLKVFKKIKNLLGKEELDFLFIDGDHRYEYVRSDFYTYFPIVRRGGAIILHDIRNVYCGSRDFWEEIKKDYVYKEFYKHNEDVDFRCGTGVIIK